MRRTKVETLAKDLQRILHTADPYSDYAVEVFEISRDKCCVIGNLSYDYFLASFRCKTWDVMYNWLLLKTSQAEELVDLSETVKEELDFADTVKEKANNLADTISEDATQLTLDEYIQNRKSADESMAQSTSKENREITLEKLDEETSSAIESAIELYETVAGTVKAYELIKPIYEKLFSKLGTEYEEEAMV
jgi:hypothetical protein